MGELKAKRAVETGIFLIRLRGKWVGRLRGYQEVRGGMAKLECKNVKDC